VDGVLLSLSQETIDATHTLELEKAGIPMVFFDRVPAETSHPQVTTNDFESGYLAAKHLQENGCRRIAYLSVSDQMTISVRRREGFIKAMKEDKIPKSSYTTLLCPSGQGAIDQFLVKILSGKNRPDGLIASVEKFIIPVYQACKKTGLAIPKDVKLISFSNLPSAAFLQPALTTITQPAFEMGKAAATLLVRAMEKKNTLPLHEHIVLPSRLVASESTVGVKSPEK
jgi:LacI family transcriptional regulator